MKIFICEGCTGEYSDRSEWPVCAFLHEHQAKEWCDRANAWLESRGWRMNHGRRGEIAAREGEGWNEENWRADHPMDPTGCRIDYTGTEYRCWSVDVTATVEDAGDWAVKLAAESA